MDCSKSVLKLTKYIYIYNFALPVVSDHRRLHPQFERAMLSNTFLHFLMQQQTKKLAETSFPYMVLGALYIYLLSLSWTSETLRLMFSSKYWLPEVSGLICCGYSVQQTWVFVLGRHVQTWVMTMCLLQQPSQASRVYFGCNNKQEINLDSFTYRFRFFSFLSFQIVAVRYHTCCLVVGCEGFCDVQLPGITRMFSSTITVASAWIHLLAVDLFCGR